MAVPLRVASLYFLHVGFNTDSYFSLSLGGIAAGLCLADSLLGKQYVLRCCFLLCSAHQLGHPERDVKNFVGRGAVLVQHDRGDPPGEHE